MKSMFKKTAACALILTLILSMAACGKKETASEHQEGQVDGYYDLSFLMFRRPLHRLAGIRRSRRCQQGC